MNLPENLNIQLFASPEYRAWCEAQDDGTPEDSILAAQALVRQFPDCPSAWLCRAETWWCHGDDDSAMFGYEKALEIAEADRDRAKTWRKSELSGREAPKKMSEQWEEARQLLGFAFYEAIIFSCGWHGIGRIREERGERTEAQNAYECAVAEMPGHDQSWERLIELYRDKNDFHSLAKAYRENIKREYKMGESWLGLAEAYLLEGRPAAAISACRSAIHNGQDDAEVWLVTARAYEALAHRASGEKKATGAGQMHFGFDRDVFYTQATQSCRRAMEAGAASDEVLDFYTRLTRRGVATAPAGPVASLGE
jgi:tetratricopeptide (TPR) repeat protein